MNTSIVSWLGSHGFTLEVWFEPEGGVVVYTRAAMVTLNTFTIGWVEHSSANVQDYPLRWELVYALVYTNDFSTDFDRVLASYWPHGGREQRDMDYKASHWLDQH